METVEFTLEDDGTLDTVVECHCVKCDRTWEERFSDTSVYRDPDTGEMLDLDLLMLEENIDCDCE